MNAASTDAHAAEARLAKSTFAAWKLDVIYALSCDRRLRASDVRVAIALLHHLNGSTWRIFPSQQTVAEITGMTVRNVANCLDSLKEAGWIKWHRGNRQRANEYEFSADTVADALAAAKAAQGERKARRQGRDRKPNAARKVILTGTTVPVAIGTPVPPNTSIEPGCQTQRAVE